MIVAALVILAGLYLAFHAGHAHANYRHGRRAGHRGVNLYWSSAARGSRSRARSVPASGTGSEPPGSERSCRRPL